MFYINRRNQFVCVYPRHLDSMTIVFFDPLPRSGSLREHLVDNLVSVTKFRLAC